MIRSLLVDDEPLASVGLRTLLGRHADISVVGETRDGHDAVNLIREIKPDVVFLDIQMSGLDGFGVLCEVGPEQMPPAVVFVTAYSQFAVEAFRVRALDYLLKPLDERCLDATLEHVRASLRRARSHDLEHRIRSLLEAHSDFRYDPSRANLPLDLPIDPPRPEQQAASSRYASRLAVRSGRRSVLVNTHDIDWIEASDYCATLHLGDKHHAVRETLSSLEQRLDPGEFLRIHRSSIVNLSRIAAIETDQFQRQSVVLTGGIRLTVSRHGRERLQAWSGKAR